MRVLDFGFAGDTPYLAMEFLRGRDLGKVIKATTGFLPVAEVVDVMLSVCAAIRACHDAGIIHRDLKPSNVFLCDGDGEPEVKILDFGVSKPPIASDLTREGQIVGTPQYLAPEQVDGKAVRQTDQYAIGVMLYACLTKSLPYQNHASFGLLRAIVLGKFPTPRALRPELPEKLEEIILRAMRTAPEERFESVHALGRELLPFGSAHAREKWRAYYLDDRLKAPPKASTHAMPLIEAMARGLSPATPSSDPAGFASTALAEPIITPRQVTPLSPSVAAGVIGGRPDASRVSDVADRVGVDREERPARRVGRSGRLVVARRARAGRRRVGHVATTERRGAPPNVVRSARARRATRGPGGGADPDGAPRCHAAAPDASRRRRARPRPRRRPDRRRRRTRARRTDARTGRRRPNGPPTAFRSCRELDTLRRRSLSSRRMLSASTGGGLDRGRDRLRNPRRRARTRLRSRR